MWEWTLSALYAPVELFLGISIWTLLLLILAIVIGIVKTLWNAVT